ncbi:uncharacterized protein LOC141911799 [Tubulanus polymorphus]|uniref:uncharacterized protein LOC141911799 n=1 Tax=Tubulanus polymorphus TaxID=672921 RepID=UPI003DA5913E
MDSNPKLIFLISAICLMILQITSASTSTDDKDVTTDLKRHLQGMRFRHHHGFFFHRHHHRRPHHRHHHSRKGGHSFQSANYAETVRKSLEAFIDRIKRISNLEWLARNNDRIAKTLTKLQDLITKLLPPIDVSISTEL